MSSCALHFNDVAPARYPNKNIIVRLAKVNLISIPAIRQYGGTIQFYRIGAAIEKITYYVALESDEDAGRKGMNYQIIRIT